LKITVPYKFEELFQELEHPSYSGKPFRRSEDEDEKETEESISQFLELILLTKCGEYYFDRNFGFKFWEHIFNNISVNSFESNMVFHIPTRKEIKKRIKNKISYSELKREDYMRFLKDVIEKYESRLSEVNIDLNMETESATSRLFKYLNVNITAMIDNRYPYRKDFKIKIGPIEKKY
jgi:hypothetical protein